MAGTALSEPPGLDLRDDIDGVAALIAALDLVVTVDSWILSLTGALGVDTRFLAAQRDWASLGTERVPWLPAVTMRFVAGGDWGAAIGRVSAELDRK
jgi:ADP-heptose:LPS heptosyltransferase